MEAQNDRRGRRGAALLFGIACYLLVAAALTAVVLARRAKDFAVHDSRRPGVLRTIPAAVPVGVPERVQILGRGTHFRRATSVRLGAAGATSSKVKLLALDRIEVTIFVPESAACPDGRGSLSDLPLAVTTPLREGGEETIECRIPLTREYRPISLDLVSFGGRDEVEVRRPFVMVGYKLGGHPPYHVEIENLRTGELYAQEVSEDFEQRGIPIREGANVISVRVLDAAKRAVRKEVLVLYEPEVPAAGFVSFQGALSSYPYHGDPVEWPYSSNPDDAYIPPEQPVCCGCGCLGNGLGTSAFGTSLVGLTPPPNGDAKDCEPGVSADGGGAEGWDGQWHDLIAGSTGNGAGKGLAGGETKGVGVGIAQGSGGGVLPTTGQWRSEAITDIAFPGRGLDFKFVRRYHSDRSTDGYLGKGWDFNYAAKFEVYRDPYGVPLAGLFSRGDYRRDKFSEPDFQGGEYVYTAHDSNPSFERVSTDATQGISRMVKRNGFTQEFDLETGLLKKRKDRYGNTITVAYDCNGRTSYIVDTSGRVIGFSYYTSAEFGGQFEGRLKEISWAGASVTYEYVRRGADVYLTRVRRAPAEWIRDVGDPDAWQTVTEAAGQDYEYDDAGGLTLVRDGRGVAALANEYDSLGPGARVSRQWHYGKLHTYDYDVASPEPGDSDIARIRHRAPGLQGAQEDAGMYCFLDDAGPEATRLPRRLLFRGPGGLPPDDVYFDLFPGAPCPGPARVMEPDGKTVGLTRDAKGNITEKRFYKNRGTPGGANPTWPAPSAEDMVITAQYQMAPEYGSGVYGAMTEFVDPLGRHTTIQYDAQNTADPVRILAPDTTDPDGQPQTGHQEEREYTAHGQLLWREVLDGARVIRVQYEYNGGIPGAGRLDAVHVQIGDKEFLTTRFSYNLWGDLTGVTDPMGRTWDYVVNSEHLVTEVRLPPVAAEGNARTKIYYKYNKNGLPVRTLYENRVGGQLDGGNPQWETRVKHRDDNLAGYVEREISPGVFARTAYEYDDDFRVVRVTDPENRTADYEYDPRWGRLARTTFALGTQDESVVTSELAFPNGQRTETVRRLRGAQPAGDDIVTVYVYDAFDRLWRVRDDDDEQAANYTEFVYDGAGRVRSATRYAAGGTPILRVSAEYDELGRRHKVTRGVEGGVTDTTKVYYSPAGLVTKVTDANGNYVSYDYDRAARLLWLEWKPPAPGLEANRIDFEYDANGNLTRRVLRQVASEQGVPVRDHEWRYAYDELNRLVTTTYLGHDGDVGPNATTQVLAFDGRGLVVLSEDENHVRTRRAYDGLGRLTALTVNADGSQPSPIQISVAYDRAGNVTARTDGKGQTTTYGYDAQNRLLGIDYAGPDYETFHYNRLGLLDSYENRRGILVTHAYDQRGLLRQRQAKQGQTVLDTQTFEYDAAYRLTLAQDSDTRVAFAYRPGRGELASESLEFVWLPGSLGTTSYSWDATGKRLQGLTYPKSGSSYSFEHDTLDRTTAIWKVSQKLAEFFYQGPGGKLLKKRRSAGLDFLPAVESHYAFDALDRLSSIQHKKKPLSGDPTDLLSVSYTWGDGFSGKLFEIASETIQRPGSTTAKQYEYDNAYRLARETVNGQVINFTTDPAQSLTFRGNYASSYVTFSVNSDNQVTAASTYPSGPVRYYGYDGAGNLTQETGGNPYYFCQYDFQNRLTSITLSNGLIYRFRYDALGRRVFEEREQYGSKTTTLFYYAGSDILVETNASGAILRESVFGPGVDRLEVLFASGAYPRFPLEDSRGSVLSVVDLNGATKTTLSYTAFGETTLSGEPFPYAFTGRRYLPELGLYDYRSRFYHPWLSRFLQRDPIGIWGDGVGLGNGYAYAGSNPISRVDPFGLEPPAPPPNPPAAPASSLLPRPSPKPQTPKKNERPRGTAAGSALAISRRPLSPSSSSTDAPCPSTPSGSSFKPSERRRRTRASTSKTGSTP